MMGVQPGSSTLSLSACIEGAQCLSFNWSGPESDMAVTPRSSGKHRSSARAMVVNRLRIAARPPACHDAHACSGFKLSHHESLSTRRGTHIDHERCLFFPVADSLPRRAW